LNAIPVHIITGFLGAGKTSAILQLLRKKDSEENWAVIVNEFGKISIDGQTLRSSTITGDIFDISGGCICCSAKGYFQENLEKIIYAGNYTRIVIEPSGLGGAEMISEIVKNHSSLSLMPILCLVDVIQIENSRLRMNPIYRNQIIRSDVIAFTKCDLVADFNKVVALRAKFMEIFPGKEVVETISLLSPKENPSSTKVNLHSLRFPPAENKNLSDKDYQKKIFSMDAQTVFVEERLVALFYSFTGILRAKGYVRTESGWRFLNYTLSGCDLVPCESKERNELIVITEAVQPDYFQLLEFQLGMAKKNADPLSTCVF